MDNLPDTPHGNQSAVWPRSHAFGFYVQFYLGVQCHLGVQ